jgi:hypothetical protein
MVKVRTISLAAVAATLALSSTAAADVGGHGFVRDARGFRTIDAPGASSFTVAFGRDERGRTVGGHVDRRGRLHGFLRDGRRFRTIEVPHSLLLCQVGATGTG